MINADIDIDISPSTNIKEVFPNWINASMIENNELKKHPVGFYPQTVPVDPITGLSAVPYKLADDIGYFKLDFLNLNFYTLFSSRAEMKAVLNMEPDWDLLRSPSTVKSLFQIANHFETINKINPRTIEELADVNALIRPGKAWLIDKYTEDKQYARYKLYEKSPDDAGYSYKKSHCLAYALVIVLQLNLISAGIKI